jgi:hypothetical protein
MVFYHFSQPLQTEEGSTSALGIGAAQMLGDGDLR